jgi:ABC-type transport system substrate-binding protein
MRPQRWLGIAMIAGFLLTGCGTNGGGGGPEGKQTERLTIAIGVDPDTMDPMRQTTTTVSNIVNMIVESLGRVDQSGKVVPNLATAWQESSDAMSWTFTLRTGVTFSDGAPFDAAAVKANLDREMDPHNVCPQCSVLANAVNSVDVVDAGHAKFEMKVPMAADVLLGLVSLTNFGMMSPRVIQKGTPGYPQQEQPVGTGPYVLKERVKGDHVTLVRNDDYWNKRPTYEQQVFLIVPDSATREALVRSGQAQVTVLPPVSDLPSLQKDPTVKVLIASGDRAVFFAIDTQDTQQPLLQNVQVRQALNLAINRDAIVKSTLFGAGVPATAPMAPSVFGYCQVPNNPYTYNPDLARSMLQKANATGMRVSLISPTGRYLQDWQAAQNVANDLRSVGVNVDGPRTLDWPTYLGTVNVPPGQARVDLHLLGWAPQYLDASQAMQVFDPDLIPPKGLATAYYDNPAVADLIHRALVEPDRNARAQEYCSAEQQIWKDAPWIFLWTQSFPIIYSAQVTGVGSVPNEQFYTVYAAPA